MLTGILPLAVPVPDARVETAHAIVAASEPRLYANTVIREGVVHSEGKTTP